MAQDDERPPLWVGHIHMKTDRLAESSAFMEKIGMRPLFSNENVAVYELRGGTHLVLLPSDESLGDAASFDLMVEDLDATHARFVKLGLEPSAIDPGKIHSTFEVKDPSGQVIVFKSSHVSDLPV